MPTTICAINQKGGCGKSSTVFHLAGSLAAMDKKVLLIDADPQGSLSQGFFGSTVIESLIANQTLAAIFNEDQFFGDFDSLILNTSFQGISIVPTNQFLAPYNSTSPELSGTRQYFLRDAIESIKTEFDYVLIDCPPNLYQCSWNAMVAADRVLIPVPPEDFGTQGLRAVHQAIEHARQLNPGLRRLGHVISRSDRRLLIHQRYESYLRKTYKSLVLKTTIPELSAFKVSLSCRTPVEQYARKSAAAGAMRRLAKEIEELACKRSTPMLREAV